MLTFGIGGDSANGKGDVNVTNFSDGFIHTQYFGSTGIMAQSVGGRRQWRRYLFGGRWRPAAGARRWPPAATAAWSPSSTMARCSSTATIRWRSSRTVGGARSAGTVVATIGPPVFIGGDSGAPAGRCTVTNTYDVLKGNGSVGIFAQSVGGGGGVMTAGTDGIIQAVNGGKGDGGVVTINSNVAMLITGDNSVGVFAQSIGGGGGVGGFSGNFLGLSQTAPNTFAALVAGPQGFSGRAGGAGIGGDVKYGITANLYVTGKNSSALMEQSSGGSGDIADNGDINVTIAQDVMIIGGSGAGAGISYLDGRDNLTNNGFVGAVTGADGCIQGRHRPLAKSTAAPRARRRRRYIQ